MDASIKDIVESDRTSYQKAEQCLISMEDLKVSSQATRQAYATAALTFALLAIEERIREGAGDA